MGQMNMKMSMIIKTIQWNIGGGNKRKEEDDPVEGPYTEDGMEHIEQLLARYRPDIVTLQETHADGLVVQAEAIAEYLGLPHVVNDVYQKPPLRTTGRQPGGESG